MKKSNLVSGFVYLFIGTGCLLTALRTNTKIEALLYGFAGAGIAPGILTLCKYFYWSEHKEAYSEKLQKEEIELRDELKEKIRDKSGRYTYVLGLVVIAISIPFFVFLDQQQILQSNFVMIAFLFIYLIFQYVAGIVIFKHLMKKIQ